MRNKIFFTLLTIAAIIAASSCRKNFEYTPSEGNLTFSKDTVYLDTVFANIGSSTYTLKVYNKGKNDVVIPSISLKNGTESFYRLNVDGIAGKRFSNIPVYAKDSLFILIETTISIDDTAINELLYTDAILFDTAPNQQQVNLITLAKDAVFIFQNSTPSAQQETTFLTTDIDGNEIKVKTYELQDNLLHFTNEKPYVIYGYAAIKEGTQLQIDPGARLYFHSNSGLIIKKGAKLIANGFLSEDQNTQEGEIIFEGDRLEPEFTDITAQWGGIWLLDESIENSLNYCTIKNATIGIYTGLKNNDSEYSLKLSNSQIYNNQRYNLWTSNATVLAQNSVIGGAGLTSLNITNGGHYSFIHSTIANYWNKGFRLSPALSISNLNSKTIGYDLLQANFKNCIIDGSTDTELLLSSNQTNIFNFHFQNCLIKYPEENSNGLHDFQNSEYYTDILINGLSEFYAPRKNDFRVLLNSDVINKGNKETAANVPLDIVGLSRIQSPDLGSYQAKEKED